MNAEIGQFEAQINQQFVELKELAKGHVDALVKEKEDKINNALSLAEQKLDQAEKALTLIKARREVNDSLEKHDGLKDAFIRYIRFGKDGLSPEQHGLLETHTKASMNSAVDPQGGYLVIPYFDSQITKRLYETSPMRSIATVKTIGTSDTYEKPTQLDLAPAYWQDRDHAYTQTNPITYGRTTIRVHKLIANPKISDDLISDSFLDVERELQDSIAESMGIIENTAFVLGTGKGQPRGFMTYSHGTTWGTIEQVPSGAAATLLPDSFTNLVSSVIDTANNRFVMNRRTLGEVRKLKDENGNAIWSPQLAGQPATLLGYPISIFADMVDVAAGTLPIAFGNFSRGYYIIDRAGTRVLRNPYTDEPFVKFTTSRRVGGDVIDFDAIKILRVAVS